MAGLSAVGLTIKTAAEVREDINAELRGLWGASFDLSDSSPDGQLIGIVAKHIGLVWSLAQAVYSSNNRDTATGAALDGVSLLGGTLRPDATYSTVTLTLTGSDGTAIATGSRVKSASVATTLFQTTEDATLVALDLWASSHAYAVDDRVANNNRSYQCITAGTSAGSGGPTTTSDDITDGSAHWRYLGEDKSVADVAARCTVTGPIAALSGDLTVIDTPIGGWQSAINLLDADLGRDVATDAELRLLGEADLAKPGATTPDAIRETLLAVTDVESVTVFHNPSDTTDGDGIPPHAVEAVVRGGDDQDVFDAIGLSCIAAGIATHGTETGSWTDSEGASHVIKFTRPDEIEIWISINLTKIAYSASDPDTYPLDGDQQIIDAILAYGETLKVGRDLSTWRIGAIPSTIPGVLSVTTLTGTVDPPAGTGSITITARQLAVLDSSRIEVTSVDGTP